MLPMVKTLLLLQTSSKIQEMHLSWLFFLKSAYKCYEPTSHRLYHSHHVEFVEHIYPYQTETSFSLPTPDNFCSTSSTEFDVPPTSTNPPCCPPSSITNTITISTLPTNSTTTDDDNSSPPPHSSPPQPYSPLPPPIHMAPLPSPPSVAIFDQPI